MDARTAGRGTLAALLTVAIALGGAAGTAHSQEGGMPDWIRSIFLFWTDGQIGDSELLNAIGFLVDRGIISTGQSGMIESLERDLAELHRENENLKAENAELRGSPGAPMERMHGSISTQTASPILGDQNAGITIVEFGDYQCSNCKAWFDHTRPSIYEDYIKTGKVNMVFVDFPFIGDNSRSAAQASYCAEDQSMYWEYHDKVYSSQGRYGSDWASVDNLKGFAADLGLDADSFAECLDSGKYQDRVSDNLSVAAKADVTRTPTFVIVSSDGQERVVAGAQPYSTFQSILDSLS